MLHATPSWGDRNDGERTVFCARETGPSGTNSLKQAAVAPTNMILNRVRGSFLRNVIRADLCGSFQYGYPPQPVGHLSSSASSNSFETILLERKCEDKVALVSLNRPKHLNAISDTMSKELLALLWELDADKTTKAVVITGQGKAFCAGADIKNMSTWTYASAVNERKFGLWENIETLRTPLIGAINGAALGGGCELAMMCDVLLANKHAFFGQPEVKLGLIPGMGGTQRLIRAVGKSRAMEMILTGETKGMTAQEACERGLVSRVVGNGVDVVLEAVRIGEKIAGLSGPVVGKAKEMVNLANSVGLKDGLKAELREFWSCFGLDDCREGLNAFLEKREATFKDE